MSESIAIATGVPGWLGSRFVTCLLNGLPDVPSLAAPTEREVRVLTPASELNHPFIKEIGQKNAISIIGGDLRSKDSLRKLFDKASGATVFHIAGIIHPARVSDFFEVNTQGTQNMLELSVEAGVRRFIYVSSNSPIGTNVDNKHLFDENSAYKPYMNYGKSKWLAEKLVLDASSKMETVIIRPPWFYGPGQPVRQLTFFTMVKNGKAPIVGSGDNMRSMAYVDNICQGLLLAEKTDKANKQIYWIADKQPYSMNQIVDTIEKVLEKDFGMVVAHKRMRLPSIASEIALLVDATLQGAGIYHQKIHVLSEMNKNIACSIAKAQNELGYDPKISLEEGMRRSIQSALDDGGVI